MTYTDMVLLQASEVHELLGRLVCGARLADVLGRHGSGPRPTVPSSGHSIQSGVCIQGYAMHWLSSAWEDEADSLFLTKAGSEL